MKPSILFVDEDSDLLQALQRLLRPQREAWEMVFVDHPASAIHLLQQRAFDIVLADLHMRGLDAARFMADAARLSPASLRVLLVDHGGQQAICENASHAHQFLSKPCEPAAVVGLMERAVRLRRILMDTRLRRVTAGLANLPSPPDLYLRLTDAMARDDVSPRAVARIIAEDLAMTAELLKITNSSYFGITPAATTAEQAIRVLGLETVRCLTLAHGVFRQCQGKAGLVEKLRLLNLQSSTLAGLSQRLAQDDGASDHIGSVAYCASLLSSIGTLVLLDTDAERYEGASVVAGEIGVEAAERAAFGASHAEIGAYLLGLWGFSVPVVEAVFYQLRPSECPSQSRSALTYVHLARAFGPRFPTVFPCLQPASMLDRIYVGRLGLGALPAPA